MNAVVSCDRPFAHVARIPAGLPNPLTPVCRTSNSGRRKARPRSALLKPTSSSPLAGRCCGPSVTTPKTPNRIVVHRRGSERELRQRAPLDSIPRFRCAIPRYRPCHPKTDMIQASPCAPHQPTRFSYFFALGPRPNGALASSFDSVGNGLGRSGEADCSFGSRFLRRSGISLPIRLKARPRKPKVAITVSAIRIQKPAVLEKHSIFFV